MAAFATEADVRLKFQLENTATVPSALVVESIDAAHADVLRVLRDNPPSPEAEVIRGEVLLAGAYVLRSLASREAAEQKQVTVGGQQVSTNGRFDLLLTAARVAEEKAWSVLEPYVVPRPTQACLAASDTTPVLGEE